MLLASIFIEPTGLVESTVRYKIVAIPLVTCIAISSLLFRRGIKVSPVIVTSPVLFLALIPAGLLTVTFTLIVIAMMSILFVASFAYFRPILKWVPIGRGLVALAVLATVYVLSSAGEQVGIGYGARTVGEVNSLGDILPALEFKAFGDRGILWGGVWSVLVQENNVWPPIQPPLVSYEAGHKMLEVTFGAHNIGLELLRQYGFVVGSIGLAVYVNIVLAVGKGVSVYNLHPLTLVIGAVVLATSVIGGLTGHFVLMNNFSFLLMSLAGIVVGSVRGEASGIRRLKSSIDIS